MIGIGDRVGRYEMVRRLGAGGAGEVWEAVLHGPEGFRRPVALKVLRGPVDADGRAALAREARLGALLHHPNVVAVHEVFTWQDRAVLVMERVRGAWYSLSIPRFSGTAWRTGGGTLG